MDFKISTEEYIEYLEEVYKRLLENRDYITELDLATGDGDHWVNMNLGFEEIVKQSDELKTLSLAEAFKKISMIMMSKIGGSSGVLYGGAYMAASKTLTESEYIGKFELLGIWEAMLEDIMNRGKTEVGSKTMVDSLYPAVDTLKTFIDEEESYETLITKVSEAAIDGANSTKDMPAIRGRASYQANKGVGHLDPGAVTMSYQIEEFSKYVLNKNRS